MRLLTDTDTTLHKLLTLKLFLSNDYTYSSGQAGSAFAIEPTTTSMGGKIACSPRAIIVLAVPRLPEIPIPPISLSIAPSKRAVFTASCKKIP